jgi:phosphopantetheine--protein transferase-like protein
MARPALLSVGVDVCHVPRVAAAAARFGDRFLARAFHPAEVARYLRLMAAATPPGPGVTPPAGAAAAFLASRWAAKEALHKALRGSRRLLFPEVEVAALPAIGAAAQLEGDAFAALLREALLQPSTSRRHSNDGDDAVEGALAALAAGAPVSTWNDLRPPPPATGSSTSGPPCFVFHGAAAGAVAALRLPAPPLLSLSHDGDYALAFVALPAAPGALVAAGNAAAATVVDTGLR